MIVAGTVFKHTFIVDDHVYNGFRSTFKDENILHTNAEYASDKGFAGRVMYGTILNGFLSYFVGELLPIKNVIIQSQTINYIKPVYLNDELAFEAKVVDYYESVKTAEIKFRFSNSAGLLVAKGLLEIGTI